MNRKYTVVFVTLLINLMAASFLPPRSIRAAGLLQSDAPDVSPILDETRAVTQVISVEGGQLTATAADGTRFNLVVPPKALLSEAEITMTPVIQVGQLPLTGGLVAAVQLEPEGLLLWKPASLTIEPATPVSVMEQLSFAWRQEGQRFHPYPLQLDPSSITMNLAHFSGYGVGSGTDADGDAAAPTNPQDQLEANIERQARKTRKSRFQNPNLTRKQLKKKNRQLCDEFNPEVITFFNGFLKLRMDSTLRSRDEEQLRCALNTAQMWDRFARTEVAFTECLKKVAKAFEILANYRLKALEILADKASARCGQDHQVEEAIRLRALAREARAYADQYADGSGGELTDVSFLQLADQMEEQSKQCGRFELEFDSELSSYLVSRVHAMVPIQFDKDTTFPLAESPMDYVNFSSVDDCLRAVSAAPSTFLVLKLEFDLNLRDDCDRDGEYEAKLMSMTIFPRPPFEQVFDSCINSPPSNSSFWASSFDTFHSREFDVDTPGYVIRNWEKGSKPLLATKTYDRSISRLALSEKTVLKLFHRPE